MLKKATLLFFIFTFIPLFAFSQTKTKLKNQGLRFSTTLNFYPKLEPYSFAQEYYTKDRDILLKFITRDSGTFTVTENDSLFVTRTIGSEIPSQLVNVGASVQFITWNRVFHEISLTKLSFSKSSYVNVYTYTEYVPAIEDFFTFYYNRSYEQRTAAFAFRYEVGKYFGKRRKAPVRFGLSGAIETSFYSYKRQPESFNEYPITGRLLTFDVALISMLSFKLSKKMTLDFKLIPNILIADYGKVREENPTLPMKTKWSRNYSLPEIDLAFSVLLRYELRAAKRKKR